MKNFSNKKIQKNLTPYKIIAKIVLWIIVLTPIIWFILSFIDVNLHNSIGEKYGEFHSWNLFTMF